jgi:hypothetical protein
MPRKKMVEPRPILIKNLLKFLAARISLNMIIDSQKEKIFLTLAS